MRSIFHHESAFRYKNVTIGSGFLTVFLKTLHVPRDVTQRASPRDFHLLWTAKPEFATVHHSRLHLCQQLSRARASCASLNLHQIWMTMPFTAFQFKNYKVNINRRMIFVFVASKRYSKQISKMSRLTAKWFPRSNLLECLSMHLSAAKLEM